MTSASTLSAHAAEVPGRPAAQSGPSGTSGAPWRGRSVTGPTVADGYADRLETAADLAAALPPGAAIALVTGRAAGSGPPADPAEPDWLRSSGKTQLAAAFAESLWQ